MSLEHIDDCLIIAYRYHQQLPSHMKPLQLGRISRRGIVLHPSQITFMEKVILSWLGPNSPLNKESKLIIYARCGRGYVSSWRKVSKRVGRSHEYCRRLYLTAMVVLDKWLKNKGKKYCVGLQRREGYAFRRCRYRPDRSRVQ